VKDLVIDTGGVYLGVAIIRITLNVPANCGHSQRVNVDIVLAVGCSCVCGNPMSDLMLKGGAARGDEAMLRRLPARSRLTLTLQGCFSHHGAQFDSHQKCGGNSVDQNAVVRVSQTTITSNGVGTNGGRVKTGTN